MHSLGLEFLIHGCNNKSFDSGCTYIKKWIPELEELSPKEIHQLDKKHPDKLDYPKPMVNHKSESIHTKEVFKKISAGV